MQDLCKLSPAKPEYMDSYFMVRVCMGGFTTCVRSNDIQMPGSKFRAPEIIRRCRHGGWDVRLMVAEESLLKGGRAVHLFVCRASWSRSAIICMAVNLTSTAATSICLVVLTSYLHLRYHSPRRVFTHSMQRDPPLLLQQTFKTVFTEFVCLILGVHLFLC